MNLSPWYVSRQPNHGTRELIDLRMVATENEIDETVLPSLTDEHLKELGATA